MTDLHTFHHIDVSVSCSSGRKSWKIVRVSKFFCSRKLAFELFFTKCKMRIPCRNWMKFYKISRLLFCFLQRNVPSSRMLQWFLTIIAFTFVISINKRSKNSTHFDALITNICKFSERKKLQLDLTRCFFNQFDSGGTE